jgi:NSS family neurotransmitter:Na+ symporter
MSEGSTTITTWSSRLAFLLAAVGASVGLGNIWKFPYLTGVNGGGAFVLIYIGCALLVAIPILIGELLIGRRGRHSPPLAMRALAEESGRSRQWGLVAWMGVIVGYLILSYYSVIAGWATAYFFDAASGQFSGLSAAAVTTHFDQLLASPTRLVFWHTVFMLMTALIISRGVHRGIERAVQILMPALFLMLLALIGYSAYAGDLQAALQFLFQPDFSKINGTTVLTAVGQAFFSIGVAMGLMMAYGAYIPKSVSLTRSAFVIAGVDTAVALLAGIAIFPLVFANDLDPAEGPGLLFVTLPLAFGQMPGGVFFGSLFFLLLVVAALTSAIAVLEPIVAWAIERFEMSRVRAVAILGTLAWLIGLLSAFSFNIWADLRLLGSIPAFANSTPFDLIDYLTANIMMPLGGLLMAIFVGWRMHGKFAAQELALGEGLMFKLWHFLIRVVVPIAILAIFIVNLA